MKYKVHYFHFLIGENEWFYEDMAKKGWLLEKRGVWFSRFKKNESSEILYRIELAGKKGKLPEEQVDLYEECGWKLVTRIKRIYVFSAPKDSAAPEFYTSTKERLESVKYIIKVNIFWIIFTILLLSLMIYTYHTRSSYQYNTRMFSSYIVSLIKGDAFIGSLMLNVYLTINVIVEVYYLIKMYRNFDKANPINVKRKKFNVQKLSFTLYLLAFMIMFIELGLSGSNRGEPLPFESKNQPYIILSELGFKGNRVEDSYTKLFYENNILSYQISTYEEIQTTDGKVSLHQEIIYVRSKLLYSFAKSYFLEDIEKQRDISFDEISIENVEEAYRGSGTTQEYLIFDGQRIYHYIFNSNDDLITLLENYQIFN